MVELARLPLKLSTAKEMECYVQVGIAVLQRREPLPDGNLDSKLLLQLPPQRLLEGLPLLDRAEPGLRIRAIHTGGMADSLGLRPGDEIHSIGGEPIRDPIDFRFHFSDQLGQCIKFPGNIDLAKAKLLF